MGLSAGKVNAAAAPDPEPLKTVDQTLQKADTAERRKIALAKGLQATWTRGYDSKSKTLG